MAKQSLREKVREYEKELCGEAAKVFRETFQEQFKATSVQRAFVAAKEAAAKVKSFKTNQSKDSSKD